MRRKVTLDLDTRALLEDDMRDRGVTLDVAANDAIRRALSARPASGAYTTPRRLGPARVDLTSALLIADALEDEAASRGDSGSN